MFCSGYHLAAMIREHQIANNETDLIPLDYPSLSREWKEYAGKYFCDNVQMLYWEARDDARGEVWV